MICKTNARYVQTNLPPEVLIQNDSRMCPCRVANFQCGEFSFPSDTENNPNVLFLSVPVNSPQLQLNLTLSRRRPLSYRNQSIDLLAKSMDWFLYDTASVLKGLNPNQNDINSPYIPFHNESSRWFKKKPLEHLNQIMYIKQFSRIFYYCPLNKSSSTQQFVSTVSNLLEEFQHAEILFVKSFISLCVRVSVDVCVYTLPMLKLLSFAMISSKYLSVRINDLVLWALS